MKKIIFIGILAAIQTIAFGQIYSDSGTSSIEIPLWENDGNFEYCYKIIDVNYKVLEIDLDSSELYIAKYITTTKSCPGFENANKNIKIELRAFDKPQKIVFSMNKKCDEIKLDYRTYKTIIYGCCDMPSYFEVFDYKHNPIIQAHNRIIVGEIPQSHIKIYVGYEYEF